MLQDKWIEFAVELQSLAQAGLAYGKDVYDLERYTRIREIAAEMIACKSDIPLEKVKNLFCNETGYQTPKVDTRAAVFKEGKIHMIIWNSDGSQTENSGNGIRIFAKYLKDALDSISTYDSDKKMAKIDIYDSVSPVIIRTGRKGERENLKIVLPARLRDD